MPALAEHSTAPILVFDSDGHPGVQSGARGNARLPAAELVGTSFGRLLDMPSQDQPRLFRRSDEVGAGFGRALPQRPAPSICTPRSARLSGVAIGSGSPFHDVSEVRADWGSKALTDDATELCSHVLFYDRIDQAILAADRGQQAARSSSFPAVVQADRGDPRPTVRPGAGRRGGRAHSEGLAPIGHARPARRCRSWPAGAQVADPEQAAGSATRVAELMRQPLAVRISRWRSR